MSIPGPASQSESTNGRERYQWVGVSISITSSRSGACRRIRRSATQENDMTRTGDSLPAQPNSSSSCTRAPLDQTGIAGRVLGLDGQLHPPRVVGHGLEQATHREHLGHLGVAVRGLVVQLTPRVLPGREVEVLEIGKLHGGDDAVGLGEAP